MTLTLQEVMDTCTDWIKFCDMKGIEKYAYVDGFGHTTVDLTLEEACNLGIVKSWKFERN